MDCAGSDQMETNNRTQANSVKPGNCQWPSNTFFKMEKLKKINFDVQSRVLNGSNAIFASYKRLILCI